MKSVFFLLIAPLTILFSVELFPSLVPSSTANVKVGEKWKELELTRNTFQNSINVRVSSLGVRLSGGKIKIQGSIVDEEGADEISIYGVFPLVDEEMQIKNIPNSAYSINVYLDDGTLVYCKDLILDGAIQLPIVLGRSKEILGKIDGIPSFAHQSFVRVNGLLFPINAIGEYKATSFGTEDNAKLDVILNFKSDGQSWKGRDYSFEFLNVKPDIWSIPKINYSLQSGLIKVDLDGPLVKIGWDKLQNRIPLRLEFEKDAISYLASPDKNGKLAIFGDFKGDCKISSASLPGDIIIVAEPNALDIHPNGEYGIKIKLNVIKSK